MKTKFLYVCSDDWDTLPSQKSLKSELKCKEVIELSDDVNEMFKVSSKTSYKAGPLKDIYFTICSHRTHYFSIAWGIDDSNQHSRRNRKVFLISNDVDPKYLTILMLKAPYKARAFTLDEEGINQISSYIEFHLELGDRFKKDYETYKAKRDSAIFMIKNVSSEIDDEYFKKIQHDELDFLNLCAKKADVYMNKIIDALSNGWD